MRRLWPWFLILLAIAPAALVHPARPAAPKHVVPAVVVGVAGGASSINPADATAAPGRLIADNLFPTLFRVSSSGLLQSGLATNAAANGSTVVVTLGRHTLANGAPLTAAMVARALSETLWPSTGSTVAPLLLGDVKGAAAVERGTTRWLSGIAITGPRVLQIHLTSPVSNWVWRLANPTLGILPVRDRMDGGAYWGTSDPIGSGPYRVISQVPDASMQFEPLGGSGASPLVEVERYGSVREAALALVNGEAAAVYVPVPSLAALTKAPFRPYLHFLPSAPRLSLVVNTTAPSPWSGATATGPTVSRLVAKTFFGLVRPVGSASIPALPSTPPPNTGAAGASSSAPGSSGRAPLPLAVNASDPMAVALAHTLTTVSPGRYQVTVMSSSAFVTALQKGTVSAALVDVWPGNPLPASVQSWTTVPIAPYGGFWLLGARADAAHVNADGVLNWDIWSSRGT